MQGIETRFKYHLLYYKFILCLLQSILPSYISMVLHTFIIVITYFFNCQKHLRTALIWKLLSVRDCTVFLPLLFKLSDWQYMWMPYGWMKSSSMYSLIDKKKSITREVEESNRPETHGYCLSPDLHPRSKGCSYLWRQLSDNWIQRHSDLNQYTTVF